MAEGASRDVATENAGTGVSWPVPWMAGAVESMRAVPSVSRAAKAAGIDRRQIQRWMQKDEAFALAMNDARDEALDTLEEVIVMRARTGQPVKETTTTTTQQKDGSTLTTTVVKETAHLSDNLAMFFLKRWRPEFRERYEVTGAGGGPIQVQSLQEIDRRLAELAAEMAKTGGSGVARV